jgi:hypothetical protein
MPRLSPSRAFLGVPHVTGPFERVGSRRTDYNCIYYGRRDERPYGKAHRRRPRLGPNHRRKPKGLPYLNQKSYNAPAA